MPPPAEPSVPAEPLTVRVYYPTGRQMLLPLKEWIGPGRIGPDAVVVVVVDDGEKNPFVLLDPRAVIVDAATNRRLYGPRDRTLPGEMGEWMKHHPEWGEAIPEAAPDA